MRQTLRLPAGWDGQLWRYRHGDHVNTPHNHAELELNLVTEGTGLYLLANRKYRIRRGDLLWLVPAQEHVLVDQSPDLEMWVGVFKPQTVRRLTADSSSRPLRESNPKGEYCRRLSGPALAQLARLFADLATARSHTARFNAGLGYALLTAWDHFSAATDVPVRDVHPAVERAARLIRDSEEPLGLETLAQRSGLSASRLSRLFKQQTGVALVEYRNRRRIERFLQIYGAGQRMKMLDAALQAGFGSYAQFHRVFKRVTGRSPGKHRRT